MCKIKINNYQVKEMEEDDLREASFLFSNLFGVEEKPIAATKKAL